jgi:holo-[acyl-carrier protein] synthase
VHLRNLAVTHTSLGQPGLRFHHELETWLRQRGITAHHLSISDEQDHVIAFVVLEKT